MKLIAQGAEAKILLSKDKDKNIISKQRIPKTYRHPQLDKKIRKSRTKKEAKLLTKAAPYINVPAVLDQDEFNIKIQHIPGDCLSETLHTYAEKKQFKLMQNLGKQVSLLHQNNIIHSDLTTSNTILAKSSHLASASESEQLKNNRTKSSTNSNQEKLYIIDFGLGFISARLEDKAVDLHLIKQALEAKHFQNHEKLFQHFLKGYKFPEAEKVLEQLKKVEARGRYKH